MTWAVPGFEPKDIQDVRSTYSHRILFGTAMAMGFPISFALSLFKSRKRWLYLTSIFVFATACYYSVSRGPWLGMGVALCVIFLFGTFRERKIILIFLLMVLFTLIVRPGIWQTLKGSYSATVDEDSFKGGTYQYRWKLWGVAYDEISKSPIRLLFGCGPASTGNWGEVKHQDAEGYYSWDNHFAATMFQTGFLGLTSHVLLYISFPILFILHIRKTDKSDRAFTVGIIASLSVLVFMMTNVRIFANQLFFLFWILVAVGNTLIVLKKNVPNMTAAPPVSLRVNRFQTLSTPTSPDEETEDRKKVTAMLPSVKGVKSKNVSGIPAS